jgi:hypothetical protein
VWVITGFWKAVKKTSEKNESGYVKIILIQFVIGSSSSCSFFDFPEAGLTPEKSHFGICKKRAQNQICPTKRRKTHLTLRQIFFNERALFLIFWSQKVSKKRDLWQKKDTWCQRSKKCLFLKKDICWPKSWRKGGSKGKKHKKKTQKTTKTKKMTFLGAA